jgi:hypothetical protein
VRLINYVEQPPLSPDSFENSGECEELSRLSKIVQVLIHDFYGKNQLIIKIFTHLSKLFEALSPLTLNKPDDSNVVNIVYSILECCIGISFYCISSFSEFNTSGIDEIIKCGMIIKISNLLKLHSAQMKQNKTGLCNTLLYAVISTFFNISIEGSLHSEKDKKNNHHSIFNNNIEQILIEIHQKNSLQVKSPSFFFTPSTKLFDIYIQKIYTYIPIILMNFHKNEICPPSLLPYLSFVHSIISKPPPIPRVEVSRWSQLAWEGILNGDVSLSNYENKR